MKFVKKFNDLGRAYVHLDLEGEKIEGINFDPTDLLNFHIETYAVLKPNSSDLSWNMVFGTSHALFKTMTKEELNKFASLILIMHYEIMVGMNSQKDLDGETMKDLESRLSKLLAQFDQEVNLVRRLEEFVDSHIPINSFAGVGERAQDTVEMTFYRDDVVKMTAVALLCKLMTPIFGIFIESCKKRMDNAYKEIHCSAILKDVLANRCEPLMKKLYYFISKIIKPMLNRVKLTHVFNGYTLSVIIQQIWASLMTRRFIAVDLFKPGGNLITYITSCIRAAAQTQFAATGFKTSVTEFTSPREQASEDDGNMSNLEAESRSSSKTADFGVIVKAAVEQLKERFVIEHELDQEAIESAMDYYNINHVKLTPINSYLMGILFHNELCGAKSIEMIEAPLLNTLVPIMQAYLIQQGYLDLVEACSALPTGNMKVMLTGPETQLKNMWNNSFEYRNVDSKHTYPVNEIRWDTGLKFIVNNLTSEIYSTNTAPALLELMHKENRNGSELIVEETISRSICTIINEMY